MNNTVKKVFKIVKGTLFTDPELLYKEELNLINEPFYFKGTNRKGVLLIHGWTSTPYEVRRLGKYLNENSFTVYGPRLRGHGTVPKDLEGIHWTDWLKDLEDSYEKLKNECDKVYIAGTSIGSSLAVMLAEKKPDIAGFILMATPYQIRLEIITVAFAKLLKLFKSYNRKFYPPTFGVSTTITRLISYQAYPISSALETFNLVKETRNKFSSIIQPCFLIQSSSDHIVSRNSLEKIYKAIGSKVKKKRYIKRAYHTFISDIKNDRIFEEILQFIQEN